MIKTKFICKIWAKSVGLSVRSFSIWLLFYGLSLLIRPNQHLTKDIFYQIARFRKNRSLHTSQGTCDWNLRIQSRKGQNYENCLSYFKCSLHKLLFVFSPHFMMVRKNPFKKLEYHVVSHADIEIFSVENNRLTNVLLTDAANILSTASERIWFANVSVLELGSSI